MSIRDFFVRNKQYGNRYQTDVQYGSDAAAIAFEGVMDAQARFVEEKQLLDKSDWMLFIEQFRTHADDHDIGWRGEYFGKMMRGAAMTYQYTKNEALYALLAEVAEQMLEAQDGEGRFSSYSKEAEFHGWDLWSRKYVLLGFLHFHEICRDGALRARIERALQAHLDYIVAEIYDKKVDIATTTQHWGGASTLPRSSSPRCVCII